ncbi:MAG TPA: hypothetical protein VGS07_05205 [Thermoanaerobaculia bacterium]|jgi:hypothetical protein|nr:hypothetical protein [Thermoanaerobaculia bacterium]
MWGRVLGISVSLFALCGCSTVPLPSTIPLYGWTPVTDKAGDILPVGTDRDFLRAASPNSEGPENEPIGIRLIPGDVIYLRRWSPGMVDVDDPTMNLASPIATVDRIPLRKVAPGHRLFDYEREFLINVLTTNRSAAFKGLNDRLNDALLVHEIPIWNALIRSLIVKRFAGNGHDQNLMLVVRMPDMLAGFPDSLADLRSAFLGAPRPSDETGERPDRDFEVTSLEAPVESPYHALRKNLAENPRYFSKNFRLPRFNFLSVDLSGVRLARPGREEEQWTLQDWEESGICDAKGSRYSARIQWVQLTTSRRTFHVVGDKFATHRVRVVVARDRRERSLEPTVHVTWGFSSISQEDLGHLTARDVRGIHWVDHGQGLGFSDNCQIH